MREAGFEEVEVLEERRYTSGGGGAAAEGVTADAWEAVASVKVRGVRPRP
jgi:hypothetical protein